MVDRLMATRSTGGLVLMGVSTSGLVWTVG
jgi:hypothetical protein